MISNLRDSLSRYVSKNVRHHAKIFQPLFSLLGIRTTDDFLNFAFLFFVLFLLVKS